jgi:DNA-binding transcriptional LysR family regulator
VTIVSPLAFQYLVPNLPLFYKRYPDIQLALDLSEDSAPLVASKYDVGIRVGALDDAAFVARPLGPIRLLPCASPAYLAAHGVPRTLEALAQHDGLVLQVPTREQPTPFILQPRRDGARSLQMVPMKPRFASNDFRGLQQACIDGLGIAQLPQTMALPALRAGLIKIVLPDLVPEGWQLFIHYPSRKQLPVRVRVFVDFCIEQFGGHADFSADTSAFVAK